MAAAGGEGRVSGTAPISNGKLSVNRARSLNMRARAHRADGHLSAGDLRKIVERDQSRCVYCDRELDYTVAGNGDENAATFDHVIRLVDGGSNTWENVVCACRGCNQRNAKKSLEDPEAAAIERLRWFLARKAA
jgi:5-methylcytosine-specific restriction endonuclease McrA